MRPIKLSKVFIFYLAIWLTFASVMAGVIQADGIRKRVDSEFQQFKDILLGLIDQVFLVEGGLDRTGSLYAFLQSVQLPEWFLGIRFISRYSELNGIYWIRGGNGWSQVTELPDEREDQLLRITAHVAHPRWRAVDLLFTKDEFAHRTVHSVFYTTLYIILFAAMSVTMAFFLLKKYVISPLNSLKSDLNRFPQDLSHRLPPYPIMEFENVAQAFNSMADRLYKSQLDLDFLTSLNQEVFNFLEQPLLITAGNILVSYNHAAEIFFGLSRLDCSRPVEYFNQPIDKLLKNIVAEKIPKTTYSERRLRLKASSHRLYDVHLTRIQRKPNFFAVQIIDVTEIDRAEKVQKVQQQAETLAMVASGVVHDLNNILSGLTGTTSILKFLADSSPVIESSVLKEKLMLLEACSSRAISLSNSLLHLSSRHDIEFKPFNLVEAVANAVNIARSSSGPDVQFLLDELSRQVIVLGDQARTEQIILNLLINSVHALGVMAGRENPRGIINLDIQEISPQPILPTLYPELQNESYIRLRISDNGVGIPHEIQKKIFEPFFTTKSREKGSGLGLSLVLSGMILQKGWLNLFSEPGRGTCFDLYYLPEAPVHPPPKRKLNLYFCNHNLPLTDDLLAAYLEEGIELDLYEDVPKTVIDDRYDGYLIDRNYLDDLSPTILSSWAGKKVALVCQCPQIGSKSQPLPIPVLSFPFLWEDLTGIF